MAEISGGDGKSIEDAAVITHIDGMLDCIHAENEFISNEFGPKNKTWHKMGRALLNHEDRRYDRIDVETPDGSRQFFFFDITSFFND
ncbi:MAG: adenosylhomocysteinase [Armatimonadota bacterium]